MQGYREPPSPPANSVVLFYPNGRWGRFVYAAILCVLAGFVCFAMVALTLTQIRIQCSRAESACSIMTTRPIAGTTTTTISLSQINDAQSRLTSSKGRKYGVFLRTTAGEQSLGAEESEADARRNAAALNHFFESSEVPSVDLETNPTNLVMSSVFGLMMAGCLALACWTLQNARIEVIWNERIFRLIRNRWPLSPRVQDFPLASVRSAFTNTVSTRNGPVYGVSLRIDDEADVELPGPKPGKPMQRSVDEINGLLRLRDAGGPSAT